MTDKPDWEKAWEGSRGSLAEEHYAGTIPTMVERYRAERDREAFQDGYIAATAQYSPKVHELEFELRAAREELKFADEQVERGKAQREADIARAKREVLVELKTRARELDAEGWASPAHFWCAYEEAREKYSEPTAVAATEKEG